ncbi:hypothetical protein JCM8097_000937 [Rhodosporidiobolus ruineniae]
MPSSHTARVCPVRLADGSTSAVALFDEVGTRRSFQDVKDEIKEDLANGHPFKLFDTASGRLLTRTLFADLRPGDSIYVELVDEASRSLAASSLSSSLDRSFAPPEVRALSAEAGDLRRVARDLTTTATTKSTSSSVDAFSSAHSSPRPAPLASSSSRYHTPPGTLSPPESPTVSRPSSLHDPSLAPLSHYASLPPTPPATRANSQRDLHAHVHSVENRHFADGQAGWGIDCASMDDLFQEGDAAAVERELRRSKTSGNARSPSSTRAPSVSPTSTSPPSPAYSPRPSFDMRCREHNSRPGSPRPAAPHVPSHRTASPSAPILRSATSHNGPLNERLRASQSPPPAFSSSSRVQPATAPWVPVPALR